MATGAMRVIIRAAVAAALAGMLTVGAIPVGTAQDASAFRDLATGADYRVRVAAALTLGKSRSFGARPALEKALGDSHPAVRAACAAGLGSIGDKASLPALQAALGRETEVNAKAQLESTIQRLGASAPARGSTARARYLIAVGKIENRSGVSSESLLAALRASTRTRMAEVPGLEVLAEGADPATEGRSRNLPAFTVDGSLTKLDKKQGSDGVTFSARVEYVIRKMPDQTLKGTLAGSAQALASLTELRGPSQVSQLQLDAVSGAVDSAFKGASKAIEAASK